MNISNFDKIIIGFVGILIIAAGISIYKTYFDKKSYLNQMRNALETVPPTATEKEFPQNIKFYSKKYDAFNELYNTNKKVFIYGYKPLSIEKNMDERFHKKLITKLEEDDLKDYKIIPYENWQDLQEKIKLKNFPNYDAEACTMTLPEEKDLDLVLKTTEECLMNSCIIDAKHNKYTVLTRDIDFIIQTLKENKDL